MSITGIAMESERNAAGEGWRSTRHGQLRGRPDSDRLPRGGTIEGRFRRPRSEEIQYEAHADGLNGLIIRDDPDIVVRYGAIGKIEEFS